MKNFAKSVLRQLGLLESLRKRKRMREHRDFIAKYKGDGIYTLNLQGKKIKFSVEDLYSLRWFYPRYLNNKVHEEPVVLKMLELMQGKTSFADVGTNLGYFTCIAGVHFSDADYYGFEMDPDSVALLKINVRLNNIKSCEVNLAAVADRPGKIEFYKPSSEPSAGLSMSDKPKSSDIRYEVPAVVLDDYFAKAKSYPQVMKIDVEGAEMGVLKGMQHILSKIRPEILLEIHPIKLQAFGVDQSQVLSFLREHQYRLWLFEDFREGGSKVALREIAADELLKDNLMIYCQPQ
jgi:FkbM family methyltransferase